MQPALQAAGHPGAQQGEGLFIKPSTNAEIEFYQWLVTTKSRLLSLVPQFMGTLTSSDTDQKLIVLEDLCQGFVQPNVLDIKLGSVLWDRHASPEKSARLGEVSRTTTSGSLGFRIAGMSLVEPTGPTHGERIIFDKQFGREASPEDIGERISRFFPNLRDNDHIWAVLRFIVAQLREIQAALHETKAELHSASVLVLYEGDLTQLESKLEHQSSLDSEYDRLVEVRLIDFAHSYPADTVDEDVLRGLDSLIGELVKLQDA